MFKAGLLAFYAAKKLRLSRRSTFFGVWGNGFSHLVAGNGNEGLDDDSSIIWFESTWHRVSRNPRIGKKPQEVLLSTLLQVCVPCPNA